MPKKVWKTRERNGKRMMICQNSEPKYSKYPDYVDSTGICKNWEEVAKDTSAVLCNECTNRSQH